MIVILNLGRWVILFAPPHLLRLHESCVDKRPVITVSTAVLSFHVLPAGALQRILLARWPRVRLFIILFLVSGVGIFSSVIRPQRLSLLKALLSSSAGALSAACCSPTSLFGWGVLEFADVECVLKLIALNLSTFI